MAALIFVNRRGFLAFGAVSVEFVACVNSSIDFRDGPCVMLIIKQCAGAYADDVGVVVGFCNRNLDRANNSVLGHLDAPKRLAMNKVNLPKWNRSLIEEVIEVLESSQSQTAEAISRLSQSRQTDHRTRG
jgi:hypothetical protein